MVQWILVIRLLYIQNNMEDSENILSYSYENSTENILNRTEDVQKIKSTGKNVRWGKKK